MYRAKRNGESTVPCGAPMLLFGLSSWLSLATSVYCFMAVCHASTTMELAHRAVVDIMAEGRRLENIVRRE